MSMKWSHATSSRAKTQEDSTSVEETYCAFMSGRYLSLYKSSHLFICALLVLLCAQELYNCLKKVPWDQNVGKVYCSLMHSRIDDYSQANSHLLT